MYDRFGAIIVDQFYHRESLWQNRGMEDIFEKIIAREIPAHFVHEDDLCIVIMDRFPVVVGQVLVIPKKHVTYLFEIDDTTYQHLFSITKKIAHALDVTYETLRTCVVVEGFEVDHAHIKLYPLTKVGLHIHGGTEWNDEDLAREAEKIKAAMV